VSELLAGFHFGTYGRVGFSWDLSEGSRGKPVTVVTHGPRLEEPSYAELDLGYHLDRGDDLSFRVLFTVGMFEELFHYDGDLDATLAVRNLYLQADHVVIPHLSLWAGSRMYRGDDIYLLDFWPLDELNTLGGGAILRLGRTVLQLHTGVNRLDDPYQLQVIEVPSPRFGTQDVTVLDRQRTIISAKAVHHVPDLPARLAGKIAVYGELHHLPSGTRRRDLDTEDLPDDFGWLCGLQLGVWGFGPHSFVNLWARVAGGLAAYDELAVPRGLGLDKRTTGAREALVALSSNYERGWLGIMFGGYARYFRDADGNATDPDDGWEGVVAFRPHLFITRNAHQMFEVSYQVRRPAGLDPGTETHLVPSVLKLSVMPAVSWERGTYARPQLRLVYTLSYLDEDARLLYPERDPRHGEAIQHFIGLQAEWWYNSSYR
jgi:maltoporin